MCRDLAVAHCEIDAPDIDSAAANLEDNGVFARRALLQHGLLHESVCMTAGNKIDAVNLRGNLRVADPAVPTLRVVTEMRHTQNQGASLLFAQEFCYATRHLHRIKILQW